MFDLIRTYQLDIMLVLIAACATITFMLFITGFLPKRRKRIMIFMEITAALLLFFDRMAYVYKGDISQKGYILVRLSNFFVFFLTSQVVFGFNLLQSDLVMVKGRAERLPKRLVFSAAASAAGMLLAVIAHFTGLYYYFDEMNVYHRGPGFLLCYIIPVLIPIIQYTVMWQYRRDFGRYIFGSITLYTFGPILMGILQIFTYGLSIVNMAMVVVSILLYAFTFLDINETVNRAHHLEMKALEDEKQSMKRLFGQTATAFVTSVEKRDPYLSGHSKRVADYAKRIAKAAGKTEDECDEIYYTALLNDVGLSGLPDGLMTKTEELTEREALILKEKPEISAQLLSEISEYAFLREGVLYSAENYDGSGYPEGLKGEKIPENARITAIAEAADMMTRKTRDRDPLPYVAVREELLTQAGVKYDPDYASFMVQILDKDKDLHERKVTEETEKELICGKYRDAVTVGIPVLQRVTRISFDCIMPDREGVQRDGSFSAPSIIVFDSFDRHIYHEAGKIALYDYLEYSEIWFDGHYVSTAARNIKAKTAEHEAQGEEQGKTVKGEGKSFAYEIEAAKYEDHVTITMKGPACTVDVIMALTDKSKDAYIGLTGENCHIKNITVQETDKTVEEGDIRRIAADMDFINRLESDLPNIQINQNRSVSTEGVRVEDGMRIDFHTVSLPAANLIWHCPYIVLFYSDDRMPGGRDYREYALIKINGESTGDDNFAENRLHMKKNASFPGWDAWKELNRKGMECTVELQRKGNTVTVRTVNFGLEIENTTVIRDGRKDVYVSLTGDLVALTDIRVR